MTVTLTTCPEPDCDAPASVAERYFLDSTSGPVEHVVWTCCRRHRITTTTTD